MSLIEEMRQLQADLLEDDKNVVYGNTKRPVIHFLYETVEKIVSEELGEEVHVYCAGKDYTREDFETYCTDGEYARLLDCEFVEMINDWTEYSAYWVLKVEHAIDGHVFLTRKHAQRYLELYGGEHWPLAWPVAEKVNRNPYLEALITFIHDIDLDKSTIVMRGDE